MYFEDAKARTSTGPVSKRKQQLRKRKSLSRLIQKSRKLITKENSKTTEYLRMMKSNSMERVKRVKTGTRLVDVIAGQFISIFKVIIVYYQLLLEP